MCMLTNGFYSFPLLAAGFAAGLTADVVESEEDVMLLMHVDRKFNLNLPKEKQSHSTNTYMLLCASRKDSFFLCFHCVRSQ